MTTLKELQATRAKFEAIVKEAKTHQCAAYHSHFTGLVKCPCKPLRIITYQDMAGEPASGDYCAQHAIELRRDEARGLLEILSDEPLYPMPFDKPAAGREIGMKGFYGV